MLRIYCLVLAACAAMFFVSGCKKVMPSNFDDDYLSVVQRYVRQQVSAGDYDNLDFGRYRVSKQGPNWYVRVGIQGKNVFSDFLLLQTDSLGRVNDGRFIHLSRGNDATERKGFASRFYNGMIELGSLDRKSNLQSAISSGYIEAFHPSLFEADGKRVSGSGARAESYPVPSETLPEVIVVGYSGAASYSDFAYYILLQGLFYGGGGSGGFAGSGGGDSGSGGGGSNGGIYSYGGAYYPEGAGEAGGSGSSSFLDAPDIIITPEESWSRPAIDLNAWMKCFDNLPNAGASYSITLLGDLPEDANANVGLNPLSGNTGHCFLQLTKSSAGQFLTQIIGFTAANAGKAIVNADAYVASKLVDNAGHKYDCSITMGLTAYGFTTVIDKIKSLSTMPYSIVNFDCLDFGLEVFNSVRPNDPLQIRKLPDYNDPFSNIANGPKLYGLLQNMVNSGSPEAGNIRMDGPNYAGMSHGACN